MLADRLAKRDERFWIINSRQQNRDSFFLSNRWSDTFNHLRSDLPRICLVAFIGRDIPCDIIGNRFAGN